MKLKAFDELSLTRIRYIEAELKKVRPHERPKRLQELYKEFDDELLQKLADDFGGEIVK